MTDTDTETEASPPRPSKSPGFFDRRPLLRVLLYYVVLGVVLYLMRVYLPDAYNFVLGGDPPATTGPLDLNNPAASAQPPVAGRLNIGIVVWIAMTATVVLMIPVIWVYAATRSKKGYQQSMVQTLIILPIVVASVVILVQDSVALAFSLGGIVGAVAFRNRLEDTKDAVYVFLSIATGLACGVQVASVALSLSVFFNLVIVLLWYTDFGRIPGELTTRVAQSRISSIKDRLGPAGKASSGFVSAIDEQLLRSMTPDQLSSLAQRALKQSHKVSADLQGVEPKKEGVLKVIPVPNANVADLRPKIEAILERDSKEWSFDRTTMGPAGQPVLQWNVTTKKNSPPPLLVEAVRRATISLVQDIKFE
jgi:hypothetical protein